MASNSDENYALNEFDLARKKKAFTDEIRYFYSFLFMWMKYNIFETFRIISSLWHFVDLVSARSIAHNFIIILTALTVIVTENVL